ncbi:PREDICTED: uncharacterized protein LOC103593889 [Galeopterus variegatus]|uniref:Uncharacterized protein LOC103593889 n=1 Tax=Galeopterus variegatus TaxID=482537 RepID=A0ABM0R3L4_GALVR|nr:PREDICTED: uncharacterized protein LOC103593889 [Galeopterus variegatus]
MTAMSPWTGERCLADIEDSWNQWESKGKQVSKVLGAAYKPKKRLWSPRRLSADVQYGWMKYQISPQIYQSLHFNELTPIQQPDFLVQRAMDQQGRHIHLVTHDRQKDLEPGWEQAGTPATTSPPSSSLSPVASAAKLLGSDLLTFLRP